MTIGRAGLIITLCCDIKGMSDMRKVAGELHVAAGQALHEVDSRRLCRFGPSSVFFRAILQIICHHPPLRNASWTFHRPFRKGEAHPLAHSIFGKHQCKQQIAGTQKGLASGLCNVG